MMGDRIRETITLNPDRHICETRLFGLPKGERHHLEQQVLPIRKQGDSQPLWKWVCHQ